MNNSVFIKTVLVAVGTVVLIAGAVLFYYCEMLFFACACLVVSFVFMFMLGRLAERCIVVISLNKATRALSEMTNLLSNMTKTLKEQNVNPFEEESENEEK